MTISTSTPRGVWLSSGPINMSLTLARWMRMMTLTGSFQDS
jgi:hypothetical protein